MSFYLKSVKNPLIATLSNHIDGYPTPINLSYLWGFGSLAGIALVVQIVTGVLLAMHYAAEIHLAFNSVEHIMRDVKGGVILRYIHANGASMFFIVVYTHIFRGLYYGSYFQPRANLWYSGILIFFLMMATAFMGYVLPWGQMSFWGATVITNLFSAIPGIGNSIVQLLWGGFSVDNPTLNRFFSLHYFVPFIIAGAAMLHLILLHQTGSNNPLGINSAIDRIPFYPYFYVKDLFGFFIFVLIFSFFVIYVPNFLGHPDNYIEANPLVTPAHIVPEWYFLPFYAVLRTIPDKLGGVLLMGIAIVILALLPVVDTSAFRSNFFKPLNLWFFWYFFADSVSLGWIGQEIVESPFIEMANFVTFSYFAYFILFLPLAGFLENALLDSLLRYLKDPRIHTIYEHGNVFGLEFETVICDDLYDEDEEEVETSVEDYLSSVRQNSILSIIELCHEISKMSYEFQAKNPFIGEFFSTLHFTLYNFYFEDFYFDRIFGHAPLYQLILATITLIFISIFLKPSVKWYHKYVSLLFIYLLAEISLDKVFRNFFFKENKHNLSVVSENVVEYVQDYSLFANIFFFYSLSIVILFMYGLIDRHYVQNNVEVEFSFLVFFILIGAISIFYVHTLVDLILALEVVTLSSYVLVAFERRNRFSTFAGVQYFILGSIPSGMLILGASLLYKHWGTLALEDLDLLSTPFFVDNLLDITCYSQMKEWQENILGESRGFKDIVNLFPENNVGLAFTFSLQALMKGLERVCYPLSIYFFEGNVSIDNWNVYVNENKEIWENIIMESSPVTFTTILAIILIFFNFLFKLTAAPFHFWAPAIYGKAPTPTSTFLSIFLKAMIFFLIYKFMMTFCHGYRLIIIPFFIFCGVISVLFGMIGAFTEKYTKRFFVYSSMGHVGFMLIGLSIFSIEGIGATFHYLPVYIISSFIMWFVLLSMGLKARKLISFKNLKSRNSVMAIIFSMLIFSMSGIPPLGGFFVKFDILTALAASSRFYLIYILFIFTVASFFYYLRIIKIIYFDSQEHEQLKKKKLITGNNIERNRVIFILFFILFFYIIIIQKPLLLIQMDALSALFG